MYNFDYGIDHKFRNITPAYLCTYKNDNVYIINLIFFFENGGVVLPFLKTSSQKHSNC